MAPILTNIYLPFPGREILSGHFESRIITHNIVIINTTWTVACRLCWVSCCFYTVEPTVWLMRSSSLLNRPESQKKVTQDFLIIHRQNRIKQNKNEHSVKFEGNPHFQILQFRFNFHLNYTQHECDFLYIILIHEI